MNICLQTISSPIRCQYFIIQGLYLVVITKDIFYTFELRFAHFSFLMSHLAGISKKAENAYPTGGPSPCSQFLVAHLLLLFCMYFLVALCSLLCIYVSFPCLVLSLDDILLITAKILVLLITLLYL